MASQQNNRPLPAAPGQQQPQNSGYQQSSYQPKHSTQARPQKDRTRSSRAFSYRSANSAGSNNKEDLTESHQEKENKRLHSKADPTMAMNEAEPAAVAAHQEQTMTNLRLMSHTDLSGNVITDPDQSNPTRWRLERPLDTIRGFESAIRRNDRSSMINTGDNESVMSWNPRNSYYGNSTPARFQHQSYYSDARSSRPQSIAFRPDNYNDQQQQGRWGPPPQDRRRMPPINPDPQYNQRGIPYGNAPGEPRSYDTVASGSGTSGERPGYMTDPTSSDNSSIERRQSPLKRQQEPVNDYGIGFQQSAEYQPSAFTVGNEGYQAPGARPPIPNKDPGTMLRKPIQDSQAGQEKAAKRKSWFSLRKGN